MSAGPGFLDAEGVYHLGEDDNPDGTFSGLMALITDPISARFALDATALERLEPLELHEQQHRQLDSTNSTLVPLVQSGIGKITGNATGAVSEAVTFPAAFATGTVPVVVASYIGSRATGAFNATSLTASGGIPAGAGAPSNTGFTLGLNLPSGSFSSSFDYYYSWIAIGVRP